jgi:hypothetical protein
VSADALDRVQSSSSHTEVMRAAQALKKTGGALRTHMDLSAEGTDLFKRYSNSSKETIDSTFNIKDFAVIVHLCKGVNADVVICMGEAGHPLMAEAVWDGSASDGPSEHVKAELLLATIAESVQVCRPFIVLSMFGPG